MECSWTGKIFFFLAKAVYLLKLKGNVGFLVVWRIRPNQFHFYPPITRKRSKCFNELA